MKKAISLAYPDNAQAPFVTAVGKDKVAEQILDIAKENNIPIVQNKGLVEVLSVQDIGTCVPEETWSILAKIFAFIIDQDGK